jgi:hypothetical protein
MRGILNIGNSFSAPHFASMLGFAALVVRPEHLALVVKMPEDVAAQGLCCACLAPAFGGGTPTTNGRWSH